MYVRICVYAMEIQYIRIICFHGMRIRVSQGIGCGVWYDPSIEDVLHVMTTWSTVSQMGPADVVQ